VAEIWNIAVLLLISFVLIVFSRIMKTRGMRGVFLFLALLTWNVALFLSPVVPHGCSPVLGLGILSMAISEVIGAVFWSRRVLRPCVHVKRYHNVVGNIAGAILCIGFLIYQVSSSLPSWNTIIYVALVSVGFTSFFVQHLFDNIEICANGVLLGSELKRWEEYESFAWKREKDDGVHLKLYWKSWPGRATRLIVPPEDRETTQQLLDANLQDLTVVETYS
jgi:hypothetical protein